MRTYKFRLYPKKKEQEKLDTALEICRQTYNHLLTELSNGYTKNEIQNWILDLKSCFPEMKDVHSKVLQMENQRLFSNLSSLSELKKKGKKVGRLRYKGKEWFKTFTYNQSGFKINQTSSKRGKLYLSKIGDIQIKLHRVIEGNIKNITIKKSNDKWYASISTDTKPFRQSGKKEIGIDLGIENYIYDSDGNRYKNPKHFDYYHYELKKAQRSLSRKKKGSNRRMKAKKKVSKIHQKISNARDDYIHKITTKLVSESKFIAVENLNIKKLMTISYNAKNIADASWGKFLSYLQYKAESADIVFQKVDPAYTTRDCSFCGKRNTKLELSQRRFKCYSCKKELDRDYNASKNILVRGKELASMEKSSSTSSQMKQEVSMKLEAPSFTEG